MPQLLLFRHQLHRCQRSAAVAAAAAAVRRAFGRDWAPLQLSPAPAPPLKPATPHLRRISMGSSEHQEPSSAGGAGPHQQHTHQVDKKALRAAVRGQLRQVAEDAMREESEMVARHVLALPPFLRAAHLGVYVHCAKLREVDTGAILAAAMRLRKVCYVPVVDDRASNMSLLHLDALACLVPAPPLNILEPPRTYSDGRPRADALQENHAATIDVLITPGLAFDSAGRRLGRGGGYYDKAIGLLRERARARGAPPPLLVALAYRAQMVAHVPTDAHDQVVDVVVTADGALACSPYAEQLLLAPASHQQQPI